MDALGVPLLVMEALRELVPGGDVVPAVAGDPEAVPDAPAERLPAGVCDAPAEGTPLPLGAPLSEALPDAEAVEDCE